MELKGYKEASEYYSSKASDIVRNLNFAGIAIIWIFKLDVLNKIELPAFLYFPLLLFVLALITDLSQYVYGYYLWDVFYKENEKKGFKDQDEVRDKKFLGKRLDRIFWGKILLTALAFILLLFHLISVLFEISCCS